MRFACFTSILTAFLMLSNAATAFEIEAHKTYDATRGDTRLKIISTTDLNVFEPIIIAFQQLNQNIAVDYTVASSSELMQAILENETRFDLAISSAMDLQTKLANDGYAQDYVSEATKSLPDWARWRDQLFAFTQEPAVLVISEASFANLPLPTTREELIELLRDYPEKFAGRIGTYDIRKSGSGYLFATQESRNTDSFWRLVELMGQLDTQLYCCTGDMITDVVEGKLAFAYNVLGSYADSRLKGIEGVRVIRFSDFLTVMLRTALIPTNAENPVAAGVMIDFLSRLSERPALNAETGLPPIDGNPFTTNNTLRPIRLGPGLLVFLDKLKKENFLRSWQSSILQN